MKYILIAPLVLFFSAAVAQKQDPVHFTYSASKTGDKSYELHITAAMDAGWHIYAMEQPKEAISVPTQIVFTKSPLFMLEGKLKETGTKEKYTDPNAGIVQFYYAGKLEYTQTLRLKATVKTSVNGRVTYQACTNEMCLPPKTVNFQIPLND